MESIKKLMVVLIVCVVIFGKAQAQATQAAAPAAEAPIQEDLIEQVCAKAASKDLCIDTLKETRESRVQENPKEMAVSLMKVATRNASEIIGELKMLIEDDKLDPKVQQGLSDCKDMLLDATDQLDIAVAALSREATQDAKKWLQIAFDATNICAASLKGQQPLMLSKNQKFRDLCLVAYDICSHMASTTT